MIQFKTITLKATPEGVTQVFTDIDSIQANSVRAYNKTTVEAFIAFGSSSGERAKATIDSFPVPPNDSVILFKDEGNDEVSVITESGNAVIRVTAIDESKGGNTMDALALVSVLKDAMGSQKKIDTAISKLSAAKAISDEKKNEAKEAIKTISLAKTFQEELAKQKLTFDASVKSHAEFVAATESKFAIHQFDINNQRLSLEATSKDQVDKLTNLKAEVEERILAANLREKELQEAERYISDSNKDLSKKITEHEIAKKSLLENQQSLAKEIEKFEARKKKIAEATREE